METKTVTYERIILKKAFEQPETLSFLITNVPVSFFTDELHDLFFKIMQVIYENGEPVIITSMNDALELSGNEAHKPLLRTIIGSTYEDEANWKYHLSYLIALHNKKLLMHLNEKLPTQIIEGDVKEVIKFIEKNLSDLIVLDNASYSAKSLAGSALNRVLSSANGENNNSIITGYKKLDKELSLQIKNILLVAGSNGSGKTRFVLSLVDRILSTKENNASVKFYNMEMTNEDMLYLFVSRRVSLTIKQIKGNGYKLNEDEIAKVRSAFEKIEKLDMEFCEKASSIKEIHTSFRSFCAKRPGKKCILVIDNLGLLTDNKSDNKSDDDIAKEIVAIRDNTDGLIIPIHHMTKEQRNKSNAKEAYRPTLDHIRGSVRISDYANQVILVNNPSCFPDLLSKEEMKVSYVKSNGTVVNRAETLKRLFLMEIAKNREDAISVVRFKTKIEHCKFQEWESLNN